MEKVVVKEVPVEVEKIVTREIPIPVEKVEFIFLMEISRGDLMQVFHNPRLFSRRFQSKKSLRRSWTTQSKK